MRSTGLILCGLLVLGGCTSAGADENLSVDEGRVVDRTVSARIDSTLRAFTDSGRVAGVSALVYEKGEEVYFGAFGSADRERKVPMARNTIGPSGLCTCRPFSASTSFSVSVAPALAKVAASAFIVV